MKTYREYSDLNDKQKMIYLKRTIIIVICGLIPLSLTFIGFAVLLDVYYNPIYEEWQLQTNSTSIDSSEPVEKVGDFILFTIAGMFILSIFGFVYLGGCLGYYIIEKLGLYTDINLDSAERHLKDVKEAITKQSFTNVEVEQ